MPGPLAICGICVEILLEDQSQRMTGLGALMSYHQSRPRTCLTDWREGESRKHPGLWTSCRYRQIPYRVHRCLMNFDQLRGDIQLEVLAAICVSVKAGERQPDSLVGGEFIIRQGMRVVASSWGVAWWDDQRTTTSYAATYEMIRQFRS
ncbi:MAG: hypothetical protein KDB68_13505 [Planctomycetes bacterium]|nr:hypothetical protein [Planctomycetota bacterium]MCA8946094.1 hypothetical protein [Planctomycetota bacterium]